jgi:hypothetical protein
MTDPDKIKFSYLNDSLMARTIRRLNLPYDGNCRKDEQRLFNCESSDGLMAT